MSERRELFLRLWPLLALQNGLLAALMLNLSPGLSATMMAALAAGVIVLPVAMAMMATRIASSIPRSSAEIAAPAGEAVRMDPLVGNARQPLALVPYTPEVIDFTATAPETAKANTVDGEDTQFAINVFDAGLRRLASADLSTRLDTPLPEEFEGMRGDFNRALRLLDDSVAAISRSAIKLHGECASARFQFDQQRLTGVDDIPILTAAGEDLKDNSATIRNQAAGLLQVSAMAGDAAARLERQGEAAEAATAVLTDLAGNTGRIGAAASSMRDIAFRTNMLSVNASVAAANSANSDDALRLFAAELRELAENAATVAKETSVLERDLGLSAAEAKVSIDALVRDGDNITSGLETMESRIASMTDTLESSASTAERTGMVLEELMKTKSQRSASDTEWDGMLDRMTHELAMINQHCGRFMKVTVMHESPPPEDRPPRARSHLRLIKS
jgi:methyl-accepting chemotaxis protein